MKSKIKELKKNRKRKIKKSQKYVGTINKIIDEDDDYNYNVPFDYIKGTANNYKKIRGDN